VALGQAAYLGAQTILRLGALAGQLRLYGALA
jgi:hypothetical protein